MRFSVFGLPFWPLGLSVALCLSCTGDGTGLDQFGNPSGGPPAGGGISLSANVQPIFTANCAFAGCHAGNMPQEGQNLSAGLAFSSIVGVSSAQQPSLNRVQPFAPFLSYLIHKVRGTQASVGGRGGRMPLGGDTLSTQEIEVILEWIRGGALDN